MQGLLVNIARMLQPSKQQVLPGTSSKPDNLSEWAKDQASLHMLAQVLDDELGAVVKQGGAAARWLTSRWSAALGP